MFATHSRFWVALPIVTFSAMPVEMFRVVMLKLGLRMMTSPSDSMGSIDWTSSRGLPTETVQTRSPIMGTDADQVVVVGEDEEVLTG